MASDLNFIPYEDSFMLVAASNIYKSTFLIISLLAGQFMGKI